MIETVTFVVCNTLAAYISVCLARFAGNTNSGMRFILLTVTNFALIIYAVVITTGFLGILSPLSVVLTLTAIAACVAFLAAHYRRTPNERTSSFSMHTDDILWQISLVLFAGFAAEWIVRSCILGTYFGPDDFIYHASVVAKWLVDGKISIVPFSFQAYYPFNAELLSLWFMLPFHNDAFASVTSFYWIVLALAAITTIHHSLGWSMQSSLLIGALFMGSTGVQGASVQKILQSFSGNDLAGPAMLLTAFAFLLTAKRLSPRDRLINSLYCGLTTGFALGIKVSFAPVVFIILLWFFISRVTNDSRQHRSISAFLFALGLILTCGYWYIKNFWITGNPLFPAELGPFKGPLDHDAQSRTKLISWIIQYPTDVNQWLRIAKGLADWPVHLGVLSAIGYAASLFVLIRNRPIHVHADTNWQYQALLTCTGLVLFFAFFFLPFSATINRPDVGLSVADRYVIFSYAIGLVLFGRLLNGSGPGTNVWTLITLISLVTLAVIPNKPIIIFASAITAVFVFFKPLHYLFAKTVTFKHTCAILTVSGFILLGLWHPWKSRLTDRVYYASAGRAADVFQELEKLPHGSRIGFFNPLPYRHTHFYRLFGRALQMTPVQLNREGSLPELLHIRWLEEDVSWWEDWDKITMEPDQQQFGANIRQSSVQYVIMTRFPFDKWPIQYSTFQRMEDVTQFYNDGYSIIWEVGQDEQL